MKFHVPSFLIGFASGVALRTAEKRLRPVVVELSALGVHVARRARGAIGRQRESVEDLLAEIDERVRERARGVGRKEQPQRAAPPSRVTN